MLKYYKNPDFIDKNKFSTAKGPAKVFWVSALGVAFSVPSLRGNLPGVNNNRAKGHTDQPGPRGVMDIRVLPFSIC